MADHVNYPIWLPREQRWVIEIRPDDDQVLLCRRDPTPAEARFLDAHRIEAYEKEAQRQLRVNRVLMSDPVVLQALRNLRDLHL